MEQEEKMKKLQETQQELTKSYEELIEENECLQKTCEEASTCRSASATGDDTLHSMQ